MNDDEWNYGWENGRTLWVMETRDRDEEWYFFYNADGLRTRRTNGTTTYQYIYLSDRLSQMTVDGHTLYFSYDASGSPLSVTYDGAYYYYVTNLQGDIVSILESTGNEVVHYVYDAWGNILSATDNTEINLGFYNPLRYRGYVYDVETKLYYVTSRYYNPEIGRFLNADAFPATGQGLLGNNMFAYCNNNPILLRDYEGHFGILTSMAIGLLFGVVPQYVSDVVDNVMAGETGADIFKARGTPGEYITAGISGAVGAIPNAAPVISVVCDIAAPAVEQGIDYLVQGDKWDSGEYARDTMSNLACNLANDIFTLKSPKYIRDIKDEARSLGKKGTKQLTKHIKRKQKKVFLSNQLVEFSISTFTVYIGNLKLPAHPPKPFRGAII